MSTAPERIVIRKEKGGAWTARCPRCQQIVIVRHTHADVLSRVRFHIAGHRAFDAMAQAAERMRRAFIPDPRRPLT